MSISWFIRDDAGIYTVALTVTSADGNDTETRGNLIEVGGADSSIAVLPNLVQFG